MTRPLLSATLIAKNEKQNVRRCLASIWDSVDEVVVVDTGSDDGTLGECLRYAKSRKQTAKLKTATFKWCDDFAAARQAADDLATGEWLIWCDMDDTVVGLDKLREMAAAAPEDVCAFFTRYRYAEDGDHNTISELWRERVVRNDGTKWQGRLHEHKLFFNHQGQIVRVVPEIAEWIHHRDHTQRTGERNLRILEAWDRDEPGNPRIIHSIAMEYMGDERHQDAADMFARYLSLPGEPPDRRAQATRHMCVMLMILNRPDQAKAAAMQSFAEFPLWPDTHLTLAEAAQTLGRPAEGYFHAASALQLGKPDTLLIINPLQYTAHPLALQAVCLAQMGRFEEAVEKAHECLQIAPSYMLAQMHLPQWQAALKKQRTAATMLAMTDVLVEAGELLKARALLDTAPFYLAGDRSLIEKRAQIHRVVRERTENPEPMPEDEQADEFIARYVGEAVAA